MDLARIEELALLGLAHIDAEVLRMNEMIRRDADQRLLRAKERAKILTGSVEPSSDELERARIRESSMKAEERAKQLEDVRMGNEVRSNIRNWLKQQNFEVLLDDVLQSDETSEDESSREKLNMLCEALQAYCHSGGCVAAKFEWYNPKDDNEACNAWAERAPNVTLEIADARGGKFWQSEDDTAACNKALNDFYMFPMKSTWTYERDESRSMTIVHGRASYPMVLAFDVMKSLFEHNSDKESFLRLTNEAVPTLKSVVQSGAPSSPSVLNIRTLFTVVLVLAMVLLHIFQASPPAEKVPITSKLLTAFQPMQGTPSYDATLPRVPATTDSWMVSLVKHAAAIMYATMISTA